MPQITVSAETGKKSSVDPDANASRPVLLPPAAADTRLQLLEAADGGRIEDLKSVAELNELKPDTGALAGEDLAAYWRRISADGRGDDVLAVIKVLLSEEPAILRTGRDAENSRVFIWPAFAGTPLGDITFSQAAHLDALAGPQDALRMRITGRYDGWQISIGADGVWHRFRRTRD